MSVFWSNWVKTLVILNLGITLFLFVLAVRIKIPTQSDGTTGHVWAHGVLREGVRKLPVWWVVMSAAMFVVGFTYLALYPGFGNSRGALGWSSSGELAQHRQVNDAKLAAVVEALRPLSTEQLAADPLSASLGERMYLDNCAACHGVTAHGNTALGAPDLTDSDWLYGADGATLLASIRDGRAGVMPAWGTALGREGVNEVAAYVMSLSGIQAPDDWVKAGAGRFATMCTGCHGVEGRGNAQLGAPNLTDATWLYGNDFASVAASIRDGRNGVMPAWRTRLSDDEMRSIAAWVMAEGHRASNKGS